MAENNQDEALAYGDYHSNTQRTEEDENYEGGERGIIGDTYRKLRGRYQSQSQGYNQAGPQPSGPSNGGQQSSGLLGSSLFNKLHGVVHDLGSEVNQRISGKYRPTSGAGQDGEAQNESNYSSRNRYGSFAGQKHGNDVKWYVDGCGYMWAVSRALEEAQVSIWILDCKYSLF